MANARSSPSLSPLPCSIKPRTSSSVAPFANTRASPRIPPPSHVSRGRSQKPPPPPVLPCRFANSVDLQDERASPGASPSRAAPPLSLPVAGDPLEQHRHHGPPPLMAAAGVRPPPPRSPSPLPPLTYIRRPRDLLHPHLSPACSLRVHNMVPAGAGALPPEPPPDLLRWRSSLPSEPLVSFLIFSSSSWSYFRVIRCSDGRSGHRR
jgi:hypothetical protein